MERQINRKDSTTLESRWHPVGPRLLVFSVEGIPRSLKTSHHLYILANKGINTHWLTFLLSYCLNYSFTSNANQSHAQSSSSFELGLPS